MEEFNFSKNLNTMLKMTELDSVTLAYCINGFMYACNVDTDNAIYKDVITRDDYKSATLTWNNDEDNHVRLSFSKILDKKDSTFLAINGEYKGLKFDYLNNYDNEILGKNVKYLPFVIKLVKEHEGFLYDMKMELIDKRRVVFNLKRKSNSNRILSYHRCFYANILEFSKILRIVKAFNDDPEMLFDTCNDIFINEVKPSLTNNQINKLGSKDDKLNEPVSSKIKKKIKLLLNND